MSHARLSPSGFGSWSKCAASVKACENIQGTTSAAAQWGTDAHTLLENKVLAWLGDGHEAFVKFDDLLEKDDVAQEAFEYALSRFEGADEAGLNPVMYAESKLKPGLYTGRDDGDGTGDIVIACDAWIEIIDLKGGKGIPVKADSGQLKIYGLGAMAKIDEGFKSNVPPKVICTIVQPRLPIDGETVRSVEYTIEQMLDWCDNVYVPAAKATDDPDATFNPGEDQCRFCGYKPKCAALAGRVVDLCNATFAASGAHAVSNITEMTQKLVLVEADKAEMKVIAEIIEAAPLIRGWLDSIEKFAKRELENRHAVPGYKLVRSGFRNGWNVSEDKIISELWKGTAPTDLMDEVWHDLL